MMKFVKLFFRFVSWFQRPFDWFIWPSHYNSFLPTSALQIDVAPH